MAVAADLPRAVERLTTVTEAVERTEEAIHLPNAVAEVHHLSSTAILVRILLRGVVLTEVFREVPPHAPTIKTLAPAAVVRISVEARVGGAAV